MWGNLKNPAVGLFILINMCSFSSVLSQGFVCPPSNEFDPCKCAVNFPPRTAKISVSKQPGDSSKASPLVTEIEEGHIVCQGEKVSQNGIDAILSAVRQVNNDTLTLASVYIARTGLTSLNLTSLLGAQLQGLAVTGNDHLRSIVGPEPNSPLLPEDQRITAFDVDFTRNILDDQGLSTTLKYFEPTSIFYYNLAYNRIRGEGVVTELELEEGEFLPGLSKLTSLKYLGLYGNRVRKVGGGQFRKHRNLQEIELDFNELVEVGDDAFELEAYDDQDQDDVFEYSISIYLRDNNISESTFSASALTGTKRRADVDLDNNLFTTLPQSTFIQFLEEKEGGRFSVEQNLIQCDPRVKWLKERRQDFEQRVLAPCANDPGQTVYTSALVDA